VNLDIQIERWPVERLIPFARNPRTHTDEQVAEIAASMWNSAGRTRSWSALTA
jgi:hypothetical protein